MQDTKTAVVRIKTITDTGEWYEVQDVEGKKYSTKQDSIVEGLQTGMMVELSYTEVQKNGTREGQVFTNRYLQSWRPATGVEAPKVQKPVDVAQDEGIENPWPGKDRENAMRDAYVIAERWYSNRHSYMADGVEYPTTTDHQRMLALSIYNDLEAARAGKI